MIDILQLYPAPWKVCDEGAGKDGFGIVAAGAEGRFADCFTNFRSRELAERIVLWRNAEDVLLRRGWSLMFDDRNKLWSVMDGALPWGPLEIIVQSNPFTALVEADEWCKKKEKEQR
jgi:hypothetical protein